MCVCVRVENVAVNGIFWGVGMLKGQTISNDDTIIRRKMKLSARIASPMLET